MSNPVSALKGDVKTDGIVSVREMGLQGMVTLRADLSDKKLNRAVKSAAGAVPDQRMITGGLGKGAAWMSPDELLLLSSYEGANELCATLSKALEKTHSLVANVSDARAVFEISGPHAREVMAKLAPVDFAPGAFEPGMFRRSRLAQAPAAFWMNDHDSFTLICFRSVARYVMDTLCVAAQEGSEVGLYSKT